MEKTIVRPPLSAIKGQKTENLPIPEKKNEKEEKKEGKKKTTINKPKAKRNGVENLRKYWDDVKAGRRQMVKRGKSKKTKDKEESLKNPPEKKSEEPKSKNDSGDRKENLREKVTDDLILRDEPKEKFKENPAPSNKKEVKIDTNFLYYGLGTIGLIAVTFVLLNRRNSQPINATKPVPEDTSPKTRKFDIGGGRIIDIAV